MRGSKTNNRKTIVKLKKIVGLFLVLNVLVIQIIKAQICGTKTVGPTGDYVTITAAFNAIATSGLCGSVVLELQSTYTSAGETFPLAVPTNATAANTITIRPTLGATALAITGSNATAIFNFNGSTYVTIDGSPGGSSSSKELTIENAMVAANSSTLRLINGSSNNKVTSCTIKGAETSSGAGVILFSTSTTTIGNNNNTIDHCDVRDGAGTPAVSIFSVGIAGKENTGNVISNCNIYNFHHATTPSGGVRIASNNTGWTITGNSFYQTASRSTTSTTYNAIQLSASTGGNFTVSNNYIGGSAPNAVGTYSITCPSFKALNIFVGMSSATNINNNTITNFYFTSTTNNIPWTGISITGGLVNAGTAGGNIIGSNTGNDAIIINNVEATAAVNYGIQSTGTSNVNISNNGIGSITMNGSSAFPNGFKAISSASSGSISNNTIGSSATSSSIKNNAYNGVQPTQVFGIENNSSQVVFSGNTISNIANNSVSSSTSNQIIGITSAPSTNNTVSISGNTIKDMSSASANNSAVGANIAVCGIYLGGTGTGIKTISGNTICNMSNSNAFNDVNIGGIIFNNPSLGNTIEKNIVHSLQLSTLNALAGITGIGILDGASVAKNNMISLGSNIAGGSLTNAYAIKGILKNTPIGNKFYYNSILIGGSGVASNVTNTAALENSNVALGDTIKNNIFVNNRSNSRTGGMHYAIVLNASAKSDFNAYYFNGSGGILGNVGGTDYITLSLWKEGTGMDGSSVLADPNFNSNTDLHINTSFPSTIDSKASAINSIVSDIDGDIRPGFGASTSDIGADEFDGALASKDVGVIALVNPTATACYTASEVVRVRVKNFNSYGINFGAVPVMVNCSVTGINPATFPTLLLNSGILAAGATLDTAMTNSYDMSTFGGYTFFASTSVENDADLSNNAMTAVSINNSMTVSDVAAICVGNSAILSVTGSNSYSWEPSISLDNNTRNTVAASPAFTTTYTVTGICGNNAFVTVTVNQLPMILRPGDKSVCSGNSVALSVSGATTYSWSPSAGLNVNTGAAVSAGPLVTTQYSVTGTDANHCLNTTTVRVVVNALPNVNISGGLAICSADTTVLTANEFAYYSWSNGETTRAISVFSPGSFSVAVTDNNGCAASNSATVTLKSNPTITTSGDQVICEGASPVALCAGGGGVLTSSLTWSPSIGLYSTAGACVYAKPSVTTTYIVRGAGANGCTDSNNITVVVKPLPLISVEGNRSICRGTSTLITASGSAQNYLWSPAANLSSARTSVVEADPSNTTAYSVTGTLNGCSATISFVLVVESCNNIAEKENWSNSLAVFPNPSNGILNIAIDLGETTDFTLRVFDLQGDLILSETKNEYIGIYQTVFDLGQQPKGMYLLQLLTNSRNDTRKIILE